MAQPKPSASEPRMAGTTAEGGMPRVFPEDRVPLPPPDAKVYTTACDYCIVGCGYKAYVWPVGRKGGPKGEENALRAEFPTGIMSGHWISPAQTNVVLVNGQPHHVIVKPDGAATVVNRGGNHSIRGGNIAQKCYNPQKPTADRLQTPLLRVGHVLQPISWDHALAVMAEVSRYVLDRYGELAWGMKMYSYQYFENTYALTKIAFQSMETPCWAPHDKPAEGNDTAGIDDAGIITFSAAYEDYALADVIFISGTDPYETKTVLFTERRRPSSPAAGSWITPPWWSRRAWRASGGTICCASSAPRASRPPSAWSTGRSWGPHGCMTPRCPSPRRRGSRSTPNGSPPLTPTAARPSCIRAQVAADR